MIIVFYYNINEKEYNIKFNFKANTENLLKIDKYYDDYYLNTQKTIENLGKLNKNMYLDFYNFVKYCSDNKINIELGF